MHECNMPVRPSVCPAVCLHGRPNCLRASPANVGPRVARLARRRAGTRRGRRRVLRWFERGPWRRACPHGRRRRVRVEGRRGGVGRDSKSRGRRSHRAQDLASGQRVRQERQQSRRPGRPGRVQPRRLDGGAAGGQGRDANLTSKGTRRLKSRRASRSESATGRRKFGTQ